MKFFAFAAVILLIGVLASVQATPGHQQEAPRHGGSSGHGSVGHGGSSGHGSVGHGGGSVGHGGSSGHGSVGHGAPASHGHY